jgi:hypothetical protein
MTDFYSGLVFNILNFLSYAYVGTLLIKKPQQHLTILCFCFGFAALTDVVLQTLYLTNGYQITEGVIILGTANCILFSVGHWKFVFQFFIGAIDTKNILWNGIEWHIQKISHYKQPIDWVVTTLIVLSMLACFFS